MAAMPTSAPRDMPSFAPVLRPDAFGDGVAEFEVAEGDVVVVLEEADVVEAVLAVELLVVPARKNIRYGSSYSNAVSLPAQYDCAYEFTAAMSEDWTHVTVAHAFNLSLRNVNASDIVMLSSRGSVRKCGLRAVALGVIQCATRSNGSCTS